MHRQITKTSGNEVSCPHIKLSVQGLPKAEFVWGSRLTGAYSADLIATKGKIRKPFEHGSNQYVVTLIDFGGLIIGYRLVPEAQYEGRTHTYAELIRVAAGQPLQRTYEGMRVTWRGQPHVLTDRTDFFPED